MGAGNIQDNTYAALGMTYTAAPADQLTISDSADDTTTQLAAGTYRVIANCACYLLQGLVGVTAVADATSHYLPADTLLDPPLVVTGAANDYVAAIGASGESGVMQFHKIG